MKANVIGGDARSGWCAEALRAAGWTVSPLGVPAQADTPPDASAEVVVLPFPSFDGELLRGPAKLSVRVLLEQVAAGQRVFGGCFGIWRETLAARGCTVRDLYGAEPLTTANAVPTAEGAIALAMQESSVTLHGARCLVIGFGRIGKVLAQKLRALSAQVTVSVRRAGDQGLAEALGLDSEQTGIYAHGLKQYDFVFNTVPAPVLSAAQLRQLSPECVLIDLSSALYGIAPELCAEAGVRCRYAPGLPGKCAPKTAGTLYARQILSECEELS